MGRKRETKMMREKENTKRMIMIAMAVLLGASFMCVVSATGFSPSSLTFNLNKNSESCQNITITSDSENITVLDSWAANNNVEWKVSSFNTSSTEHGLTLSYPKELSKSERVIGVCLSGANAGNYKGVLLVREQQVGNSIVQMGIWLKVNISEVISQDTNVNNGNSAGTGSDVPSGDSGSAISNAKSATANSEKNSDAVDTKAATANDNNGMGITGAAVGVIENKFSWTILAAVVVIGIGFFVYTKRSRKRQW